MYAWVSSIYLFGVIISIISLLIIVHQRPSKEQNVASMIAICSGLICFGYYVSIKSTSIEQLIIGKKLNYLGATAVYYFIIIFYIKYYQLKHLNKLTGLLAIITLFFLVVTTTFDQNTLYYSSYTIDTSGPFLELAKEYTILHTLYVFMVLAYSILAVGITILEIKKKSSWKINFFNNIALLSVTLVPSICYIAEKITDPVINFVPFGLLLSQINLLYLIGGGKVCDVNVLVRDYVFDSIDEAIVVTDNAFHYRESNKVANTLFPELNNATIGDTIGHISGELNTLFSYQNNTKREMIEKGNRTFRLKIKKVFDKRKVGGYVLWLQDVTAQQENIKILRNYQQDLEKEVNQKTAQLQKMQEEMINGFSALVENKNFVTGGHIQRTSAYVDAIAKELAKEGYYCDVLTTTFIQKLKQVAPLHDIGKISIPDYILDKPAKLTAKEFTIMQSHAKTGAQIIDKIMSQSEDEEYLKTAKDVARYHHEKWSGEGYPDGLSGNNIPLAARIMAIADVFDALVSERPYKRAFSTEEAFQIIQEESGKHFDPQIVNAFMNIRSNIILLYDQTITSSQE